MRELKGQPEGEPFGVTVRAVSQVVIEVGYAARDHGRLHGAGIGSATAVEVDLEQSPLGHATLPRGSPQTWAEGPNACQSDRHRRHAETSGQLRHWPTHIQDKKRDLIDQIPQGIPRIAGEMSRKYQESICLLGIFGDFIRGRRSLRRCHLDKAIAFADRHPEKRGIACTHTSTRGYVEAGPVKRTHKATAPQPPP